MFGDVGYQALVYTEAAAFYEDLCCRPLQTLDQRSGGLNVGRGSPSVVVSSHPLCLVCRRDAMRKSRIIEHISLGGVIQAPGGPGETGDLPYGG